MFIKVIINSIYLQKRNSLNRKETEVFDSDLYERTNENLHFKHKFPKANMYCFTFIVEKFIQVLFVFIALLILSKNRKKVWA